MAAEFEIVYFLLRVIIVVITLGNIAFYKDYVRFLRGNHILAVILLLFVTYVGICGVFGWSVVQTFRAGVTLVEHMKSATDGPHALAQHPPDADDGPAPDANPYPPVPALIPENIPKPPVAAEALMWQPGHWDWNGFQFTWAQGLYVPAAGHSTLWIPGRWSPGPYGWKWRPPHWLL